MASIRNHAESYIELLPSHGCFLVCVAAAMGPAVVRAAFAPSLHLLDATELPIGRAALGGWKPGSAFLIGDTPWTVTRESWRGCSCTLQRSRDQSAVLTAFFESLRGLRPEVPSLALLVHTVEGSRIDTEPVRVTGKERIDISELAASWPHVQQDVRYLVSAPHVSIRP